MGFQGLKIYVPSVQTEKTEKIALVDKIVVSRLFTASSLEGGVRQTDNVA